MPANPRWYPNELPALAQSSSSTSALETAVRTLQNDARTQSIRQALSRRSAGILQAAEQNRGAIVIGSLMPLVIDPVARSQPATQTVSAVGTVGYVSSGAGTSAQSIAVDKVTLSTGSVSSLGNRLINGHKHRVAASNLRSAILAGGTADFSSAFGGGEAEEFSYATETSATLAFSSFGLYLGHIASGSFSSTTDGFFVEVAQPPARIFAVNFDSKATSTLAATFGPMHIFSSISTPSSSVIFHSLWSHVTGVHSFRFASQSTARIAAMPAGYYTADRQVLGNGSNAWLFGGVATSPSSIFRYNVASTSFSTVSASLSPVFSNAARIGSSTSGYLCGGTTGAYHMLNSFFTNTGTQGIYGFTYATEAFAFVSNGLTIARSHPVGVSNFSGAFA